jgi:hypothetical protein
VSPVSSRGAWWLRAFAIANIVILTAVRLVTDADDFNNWDLISLVNANAFPTLADVLWQPEVHFTNPFRFPVYNTGAESVISILIHRAMSGVSLYWSNTVVVVVYDLMLLAGLGLLFRLVYRNAFVEAAAWMLTSMSTALLTFLALSAFNMQAYATLVAGLAGCEFLLQSRRRSGLALVTLSFLCISQAYPLTFFLPLFCVVWTAARVMMALAHDDDTTTVLANARTVALVVLICVVVVEVVSLGSYLEKAFWVVRDPLEWQKQEATVSLSIRLAAFFREAFWPSGTGPSQWPGFAPYFAWAALALAALASLFVRGGDAGDSERRSAEPDAAPLGSAGTTRLASPARAFVVPELVRPLLPLAAWSGLVVFGYLPAMFGTSLKSQRSVFGDLFLAMAVAQAVAWLLRRGMHRGAIAVVLLVLVAMSDAVYAKAFLSQDHSRLHPPVFDYDVADGNVRHDIDATLDYMREQLRWKDAGLVVYYPRGRNENTTDPAMFYARFLRRIGPWQRAHWIFPCRTCETRYGCAFPDVVKRGCRHKCCFFDPMEALDKSPGAARRRLYLWLFEDADFEDAPRRKQILQKLERRYTATDLGTPAPERRWHVYELTPGRPKRPAQSSKALPPESERTLPPVPPDQPAGM